jgi:hypothetical protein
MRLLTRDKQLILVCILLVLVTGSFQMAALLFPQANLLLRLLSLAGCMVLILLGMKSKKLSIIWYGLFGAIYLNIDMITNQQNIKSGVFIIGVIIAIFLFWKEWYKK